MATIPELDISTAITQNDKIVVHDVETNITKQISGVDSQRSFHRFAPIVITSGTLTLSAIHETAVVVLTNATGTVVSVDDSVFTAGATIHLLRDNSAGPVTVQALGGSTVVLRVPTGKLAELRDTNSPVTLYLRDVGANEYWNIWGDLKSTP